MSEVKVRFEQTDKGFKIIVDDSENRRDVELQVGALVANLVQEIAKGIDPEGNMKLLDVGFVDDPDDAVAGQ